MTPIKWYEDIWINFGFRPFCWRLKLTWEPQWRQVGVDVGPFTIALGWPELKRDELGDQF